MTGSIARKLVATAWSACPSVAAVSAQAVNSRW
jgi:hypothetical protein